MRSQRLRQACFARPAKLICACRRAVIARCTGPAAGDITKTRHRTVRSARACHLRRACGAGRAVEAAVTQAIACHIPQPRARGVPARWTVALHPLAAPRALITHRLHVSRGRCTAARIEAGLHGLRRGRCRGAVEASAAARALLCVRRCFGTVEASATRTRARSSLYDRRAERADRRGD